MKIVTGGVLGAVLLFANATMAQDTFRLGDAGEASMRTLQSFGEDETIEVRLFDKLFGSRGGNQCNNQCGQCYNQCNPCNNQCNPCDNRGAPRGGLFHKSGCGQNQCCQQDSRGCGFIHSNSCGRNPCEQNAQRGCCLFQHGSKGANPCGANPCGDCGSRGPSFLQKCFSGCGLFNKGSSGCNPCGNGCNPCGPVQSGIPVYPNVVPSAPPGKGVYLPDINEIPPGNGGYVPRDASDIPGRSINDGTSIDGRTSGSHDRFRPNPYAIPVTTHIARVQDAPNMNAIQLTAEDYQFNPRTYASVPARTAPSLHSSSSPAFSRPQATLPYDGAARKVPAASFIPSDTYHYDGGPRNPIPLPINNPPGATPSRDPQPQFVPRQGYPISYQTQAPAASRYTFKAYGE